MTKENSNSFEPFGIPVWQLEQKLNEAGIETSIEDGALIANLPESSQLPDYEVRIEVLPGAPIYSSSKPIKGVLKVSAVAPAVVQGAFKGRELSNLSYANTFSAYGSVFLEHGLVKFGACMSVFEEDGSDIWETVYLPLLVSAVRYGMHGILYGVGNTSRRKLESIDDSKSSRWSESDFRLLSEEFKERFACSFGSSGLSLEIPIARGAISASLGHKDTALLRMMTGRPHPALGFGVLCVLNIPIQISDEDSLGKSCFYLNIKQMEPNELPPHFGAWSPGIGGTPTYISFLHNSLYEIPGLTRHFTEWAATRAEWATEVLSGIGKKSDSES